VAGHESYGYRADQQDEPDDIQHLRAPPVLDSVMNKKAL